MIVALARKLIVAFWSREVDPSAFSPPGGPVFLDVRHGWFGRAVEIGVPLAQNERDEGSGIVEDEFERQRCPCVRESLKHSRL
jgi:hypothetical protein